MTNSIETKFEADIYILNIIGNSLSLIIYINYGNNYNKVLSNNCNLDEVSNGQTSYQ
ncbi:hypothetical protein U3516DRAFT_763970 [Neocallimastix sp. 'constans']